MKLHRLLNYACCSGLLLLFLLLSACMSESLQEPDNFMELEQELASSHFDLFEDEIGQYLRKNPSSQNRLVAAIRSATAKYHNFDKAKSAGYALDPHCVEVPGLGGMGHHAVNPGLLMSAYDPLLPSVLLFEPGKNGQMKLVGVEYVVPAHLWDETKGLPKFGEIEFADHREMTENEDGEPVNVNGGPPFPHYQLHVWIWKNNPAGMYFPLNPNVSCQFASED